MINVRLVGIAATVTHVKEDISGTIAQNVRKIACIVEIAVTVIDVNMGISVSIVPNARKTADIAIKRFVVYDAAGDYMYMEVSAISNVIAAEDATLTERVSNHIFKRFQIVTAILGGTA